jgi:DNA-binding response OmpR family regulator
MRPITYDAATMIATREGRKVPLTRLQGRCSTCCSPNRRRSCPHEKLLRAAWGAEAGEMAALHTQMYELRALARQALRHAADPVGARRRLSDHACMSAA